MMSFFVYHENLMNHQNLITDVVFCFSNETLSSIMCLTYLSRPVSLRHSEPPEKVKI